MTYLSRTALRSLRPLREQKAFRVRAEAAESAELIAQTDLGSSYDG